MIRHISLNVPGPGLHNITPSIQKVISEASLDFDTHFTEGLATVFIQHTSASLIIQENADPSARHDLEQWLNRLVPEKDPLYTHTAEGPDDMPAHIKSVLTATSLSVPFSEGRLALGTWQGIYLWEHRRNPGERRIVMHLAH